MTRLARWSLLAVFLLHCAPPPTPQPVRVATWNLHDFGAASSDASRVAELVETMAPAVIAVQEVAGDGAFADLLSRLPSYRGHLAAAGANSGGLRMGYLWNTEQVELAGFQELFTDDSDRFPRPPLQAQVQVHAAGGLAGAAEFQLVNVHLKAGARAEDEDRRVRALAALEAHLRTSMQTLAEDEFLLLGDFNEAAGDARFEEAFNPFTSDPALYRPLTLSQAEAGAFTFLPVPLFFDHLVATAGLDEERGEALPEIQRYDQQFGDYREAVSDHLPLVLDLSILSPPLRE